MSKKSKKRSVSSASKSAVKAASTGVETAASTSKKGSYEFNPDYSYVKKDLRRIGALAGSFFIVLVVLSFFLR
jgi:hypothetical protein